MGKANNENLIMEAKLSEMTNHAIHQRIQDTLMFTRACHYQISQYKEMIKTAGEIVDLCEAELRRRGEL